MSTEPMCPSCGEPVAAGDRYCEGCGTDLLVRRTPVGGPVGPVADGRACIACGATEIAADGFCEECGRAQPAGRDRMEYDLGPVAGVGDRGRHRARNGDSMAFARIGPAGDPRAVVAVVCDGVASTERADQASQAAADAAVEVLADAVLKERADLTAATTAAVAAATAQVSGATPSRRLTVDDTIAAQLVAAGMDEAEAAQVFHAHALSSWIGADAGEVEPHVITVRPEGPGAVLLCSDGLWNYLPEADELAERLPADSARVPPLATATDLTELALELGGHDNITVVVISYPLKEAS